MAEHFARKDVTYNGKTYRAGQRVPLDKMPADLAKKLVDQKRVLPDSIRISK